MQHTKESLAKLTVSEIRQLVRDHNLDYAIKGYSKLKKVDLIDKFLEAKSALPKGDDKKKKKTGSKPKLTEFDKKMGLDKPLYPESKTLIEGAKKQFEKAYGKDNMSDKQFLMELYKKMQEEKGVGKRHRKLPASLMKDFLVELPKKTAKEKPKMGRGERTKKPTKKFGDE